MASSAPDAVVIGSGPNGMAAAVALARAGLSVLVREAAPTIGGGARSAELTLPGFIHDVCSSVHAMAPLSTFLKSLPLREHGLEYIVPQAAYAQPLDDGTAGVVEGTVEQTADGLGVDADAYRRLFAPFIESWDALAGELLSPIHLPRHPLVLARFGLQAIRSATALADEWFHTPRAKALFAGAAAHSILPLNAVASASFGLVLTIAAHIGGWPIARGGSQKVVDALGSYLRSMGGRIETGSPVENVDELSASKLILCDITPRQLIRIAGHRLPGPYRRKLERFQYGPGVFKIDWALDGPIPWKAPECLRASTVHVGGTLEEMAVAEAAAWHDEHPQRPYVLLVQPSLFDPSRAPPGRHTAWGYCHVPHGSTFDMTARLEDQVERFAPGFRERILARHVMTPLDLERHNRNLVGGDITGGAQSLGQILARPVLSSDPYATPVKGLYLCSSSTPPGGGVHGLCGSHAAQSALRYLESAKTQR